MNFRANKPFLARLRKAWYFCCFGVTPALTGKVAEQYYANAGKGAAPFELEQLGPSHPYLTVIGPPPLRFQAPPLPASPTEQTPVAKPPSPASVPKPAASKSAGSPPPPPPGKPDAASPKSAQPTGGAEFSAGQQPGQDQAQPSIIPDEMRPRVRPEEFLPFFQLPGSGAPDARDPERPPPLPPSTATYRQE
jgi:hypothetical protein